MTPIVVPFRAGGKSRLPESIRAELALAMLGDVLVAATSVETTTLVTDDLAAGELARSLGASIVTDPGGGQGAAVVAALDGARGPCVVVNADLPIATSHDVACLLEAARSGAFSLVEAGDGTTNALALPTATTFAPLYGPGSALRFRAHAAALELPIVEVDAPGLIDDVDTLADLDRIAPHLGPRTRRQLSLAG